MKHNISLEYDGIKNNNRPRACCSCGWRDIKERLYDAACDRAREHLDAVTGNQFSAVLCNLEVGHG